MNRHAQTAHPRAASSRASVARGIISGALLVALLALAMAVAVIPKMLGGAALTVLSGSMEPAYAPGDVVVVIPQPHYATGEVVTFQPVSDDPTLVTHRIVAVGSSAGGVTYITRGDANGASDAPIVADQVMGRVMYSIPRLGWLMNAVGEFRAPIVVIAGIGLLANGAWLVVAGMRARRSA